MQYSIWRLLLVFVFFFARWLFNQLGTVSVNDLYVYFTCQANRGSLSRAYYKLLFTAGKTLLQIESSRVKYRARTYCFFIEWKDRICAYCIAATADIINKNIYLVTFLSFVCVFSWPSTLAVAIGTSSTFFFASSSSFTESDWFACVCVCVRVHQRPIVKTTSRDFLSSPSWSGQ